MDFHHEKDLDICLQIKSKDKENHPSGSHVISVVPSSKHKIIFAWMMHT
jgi:hypothetical protein